MGIPVVEQKRCTGCRDCISVCEPNAIEIVDERAIIDYGRCCKLKRGHPNIFIVNFEYSLYKQIIGYHLDIVK